MHPSENERKSYGNSEQATPKDELMHPPSCARPFRNERLQSHVSYTALRCEKDAAYSLPSEHVPRSPPVQSRWRLFEPNRIMVCNAPYHEDRRDSVNAKCSVE